MQMGPTTHPTRRLFSKLHLLIIFTCSCVYVVNTSSLTFTLPKTYNIFYIYYNCIYIHIACNTDLCVFHTHVHLCTHTLSSCLPFFRLNKPHCFNHLILNSLFVSINLAALLYINSS